MCVLFCAADRQGHMYEIIVTTTMNAATQAMATQVIHEPMLHAASILPGETGCVVTAATKARDNGGRMHDQGNLDPVERLMAQEEAILRDPRLSLAQREYLLSELEKRLESAEFDGFDDDDFASWVRNVAPGPKGRPGAAAAEEGR